MPSPTDLKRVPILGICLLFGISTLLLSVGCSGGDIRGSYQVQISIEQTRAPIEAILVLSSTLLPVEELPYEARRGIGEGTSEGGDYQEDQADPNSCLILPSRDPSDPVPRSVTFFEARIRAGEARVPFTIFDTSEQRMEVAKLQLFANALGGEIMLTDGGEERRGRLVGDRLEGPTGARCIEAMQKFVERRMALEPSG